MWQAQTPVLGRPRGPCRSAPALGALRGSPPRPRIPTGFTCAAHPPAIGRGSSFVTQRRRVEIRDRILAFCAGRQTVVYASLSDTFPQQKVLEAIKQGDSIERGPQPPSQDVSRREEAPGLPSAPNREAGWTWERALSPARCEQSRRPAEGGLRGTRGVCFSLAPVLSSENPQVGEN